MKDKYLGIVYNRFTDRDEPIDKAVEQFHLTVPVDRLTAKKVIDTFWQEEAKRSGFINSGLPPGYLEEQDFVRHRLAQNSHTKLSQNIAHVLPISFFEPEDFDYAAKCIIVPLKRLLDNHKFVLEVAEQTIIFVESSRTTGTMIPFIYTRSQDPLPVGMSGYRHSFETPSEHNEWKIIIMTPEYGGAPGTMVATPRVTSSLYQTVQNSPSINISSAGSGLIDYNARNAIIQGYIAEGDSNIFGEDSGWNYHYYFL